MPIKTEDAPRLIQVFIPNARPLTAEETEALPEERKAAASSAGLWLEVACPDDSCTIKGGAICLPTPTAAKGKKEGLWMKIFCPEDRCFADSPSELP